MHSVTSSQNRQKTRVVIDSAVRPVPVPPRPPSAGQTLENAVIFDTSLAGTAFTSHKLVLS